METRPRSLQPETKRPVITEVDTLFATLWKSKAYKKALNKFREGKPKNISRQRYMRTFNETEEAKAAFLDFTANEVQFVYNESEMPSDIAGAIRKYVDFVRQMKQVQETTVIAAIDVERMDLQRRELHNNAADLLDLQKITPSRRLGRALVSEILIQHGLETYQHAKLSEFHGIRRVTS